VMQPMPTQPNQANKLTLLDDGNYGRVELRIYSPSKPLRFSSFLADGSP